MIAEVTGVVRALAPDLALLSVGGVGLQVHCAPATLAGLREGEVATLATALVVREDSLTLFGFADADERAVFETLQTATGVGPRLAQAVLAVLTPEAVRCAVADDDVDSLIRVPGVGKKVAQRLILELKDRLGAPARSVSAPPAHGAPAVHEEVRDGLVSLGYSAREADAAVSAAYDAAGATDAAGADSAELLRAALALLRRS